MPSLSDPLWLGAYLGFYPGMVLLGRERFARRGVGMWLDGLLGGLALGAVTAATALQASLSHLDAAGQRRRHRRRLPAGRHRAADLPGHDVRRRELAPELLRAGARRRPAHPRRGRHDLRDRQRPRRLVRGRHLRPAWGLAMLVLAAAAWLPARRAPVMASARRGAHVPVRLRGDRGRRARLRPDRAPEPGRRRPRRARAADRHGAHGAAAARDGHAGGLAQALAHRRPHRAGQPARVHRRGRARGRRRAAVRAAHDRPRPVQGAQRHARPPRRRRAAAQRRPAAERHHAPRRRRRPPRRRRVRRAHQGRRHRDGRGGRGPPARGARARLRARRDLAARRREHRHRHLPRARRRTRARCCATPTSPCTRPSAGAWATPSTPPRATITAATASSWPARCATPWPTTS